MSVSEQMKIQLQCLPIPCLWGPSGANSPLADLGVTEEAVRAIIGAQDLTAGEGQGDPALVESQLL